jgi:predicted nuclease of predicted toxin-antitoxin system
MVGTYSVQTYTGRTAIADAKTFIEALGADAFVDLEIWAEAETPSVMIVYKA